jgi:hypothetical protein
MNIRLALGACLILALVPAYAQQPKPAIVAERGHVDDRGSARVLYWDTVRNGSAGQFAINYGRPVWESDYEDSARFDGMTKGKIWRMGSNFWTDLDTNVPLNRIRAAHLDAFDIRKAPVIFEVPMSTAKAATKADKLTIELSYPKDNIRKVTLTVAWGTLALTAPIDVTVTE